MSYQLLSSIEPLITNSVVSIEIIVTERRRPCPLDQGLGPVDRLDGPVRSDRGAEQGALHSASITRLNVMTSITASAVDELSVSIRLSPAR